MHYGLPADDVKLRVVPYHQKGNGFRGFKLKVMAVDIQGEGRSGVAQAALDRLDVIAASDGSDGVGTRNGITIKRSNSSEAVFTGVERCLAGPFAALLLSIIWDERQR